ncbi:uncharacterized protein DEA37_0002987 [Paragonimus westermani]|uniref:Secreted protein n=1 Tax=Paragonimus westermani TaxID=34504 RepID=A0A5J4N313_9TREM|nr:uncharacterized protein DEA37_0002987 [Paragonimus westermani]
MWYGLLIVAVRHMWMCMASSTWPTHYPMVLLQIMECRLPLIASRWKIKYCIKQNDITLATSLMKSPFRKMGTMCLV